MKKPILEQPFYKILLEEIKFLEGIKSSYKKAPLKRLVITDLINTLYISQKAAQDFGGNIKGVKKAVKNHMAINKHDLGSSGNLALSEKNLPICKKNFNFIAVNSFQNKETLIQAMRHEFGHLLVKNGFPSYSTSIEKDHLAECAANAYEAIRHFQQGGDKKYYYQRNNYSYMIVEDINPIYYTDMIFQHVEQISEKVDLTKLSADKTLDLAANVALKYHLKEKELNSIKDSFKQVASYSNSGFYSNEAFARKCVIAMLRDKNKTEVYLTGRRYLETPMIKSQINRSNPFWIKALDMMEKFERTSGINLNITDEIDIKRGRKTISQQTNLKLFKRQHSF